MIAFATLFIGLAIGMNPVEVVVGDEVAAVEILLDERSLGRIEGQPWKRQFDFGTDLAPGTLEAVAYDARGKEVGRARQLINLPRPRAELSVALEPWPETRSRVARLAWESLEGAVPRSVSAWLDGEPLEFDNARRIVLPPHNAAELHVFSAEMKFEGGVRAQVTTAFGGRYLDEAHGELTSIAVLTNAPHRKKPPPAESFQGFFAKDDEPLRVVAVERSAAEAVFVIRQRLTYKTSMWKYKQILSLDRKSVVRFLIPAPNQQAGVNATFQLFPVSEYTSANGGLVWLLTRRRNYPRGGGGPLYTGEAVAVAGLSAYQKNRRRAVVLILDSGMRDASQISAVQASRYLEKLRVPLLVWSTAKEPPADHRAWGQPVSIDSFDRLQAAARDLLELLDRQWIVWIEGIHLPQDIELSPSAQGITLAR